MTNLTPQITPELVAEHGINKEEYARLLDILGREPSYTELGIFSVMWSEHCSYKSSRYWLKKLPTEGPQVIQGPGENAGIVDLGDDDCAVFKMESHNHPSYIEPYQGAATGVGGIMRDIFTMGARPVANMNALRFGSPAHHKTRHLVAGVVSGIGDYGNCMGVPTIGGETDFDSRYNNNILVNAMCVGLAKKDKIFYCAAHGTGNPVIYVGSKTGRDGIHGATMASAEFAEDSEEKRPTVQVGDPFTEKLLLEACLELMAGDTIIAIQDMGAAGLTSSSVEMADKGGVGFALDLDQIPQRETNMTAYEMLLSESQERMLMVLKPGSEDAAREIFEKWQLDFAIVGETNDTNQLTITHLGEVVADIPVASLADSAPEYQRPYIEPVAPPVISPQEVKAPPAILSALMLMMSSPNLCSKRWIWEQYDHMVMGDTVARPGGDAGVVRIHGTKKGLAITTDVTPRYVTASPYEGGKQAVAEAARNLTAVGARPLAITDCLNFGNPERPHIMGQFVAALKGIGEACEALNFPVVSGNVSLYNETVIDGKTENIPPTPAIGGVGLIEDIDDMCDIAFKDEGDAVILLGPERGWLGQSIYQEVIIGCLEGAPPPVDLELEKKVNALIRTLIRKKLVNAVHDCSGGGLLVTVAEMALAGNKGIEIGPQDKQLPAHALYFGEDQARFICTCKQEDLGKIAMVAQFSQLPTGMIGEVKGDAIVMEGEKPLPLKNLRAAHEIWLPAFMKV
ncbi:MAG: phosphoribosylformylglycinamidine synthase subunit PurL [Hyphomicrobiaceae bacterium]|nr:phosphoribosylformylglycinamidine synthase subunit PurL [Hyphomicrobiaceae bacterium]